MHSIASNLSRHVGRVSSHLTQPIANSNLRNAAPSALTSIHALTVQPARHNSTLPVIHEYVRRSYPFPTILESDLPADYSKWLFYHKQFPHDLPLYKSKLTVDIRDLGLDPTSRMVLREIVGGRYNRKTHQISFISRTLKTAQANENRVFQQLDACLVECRTIAKELNKQGTFGRDNNAEHNRILKPIPTEAEARKSALALQRRRINELRKIAGLEPIESKDTKQIAATTATTSPDTSKPAGKTAKSSKAIPASILFEGEQPRPNKNKENAKALGMTDAERLAIVHVSQPPQEQAQR